MHSDEVRFARPIDLTKGTPPDFQARKSGRVLCLAFLQGSCPNGSECYLVHPPQDNIRKAIDMLVRRRMLAGSLNGHYLGTSQARGIDNSKQICLRFLDNVCQYGCDCSFFHLTREHLAFFVEPPDSRYCLRRDRKPGPAPNASHQVSANDENSTVGLEISLPEQPTSLKEKMIAPTPVPLPATYDESSGSSTDLGTSESDDSISSCSQERSPAQVATPLPLLSQSNSLAPPHSNALPRNSPVNSHSNGPCGHVPVSSPIPSHSAFAPFNAITTKQDLPSRFISHSPSNGAPNVSLPPAPLHAQRVAPNRTNMRSTMTPALLPDPRLLDIRSTGSPPYPPRHDCDHPIRLPLHAPNSPHHPLPPRPEHPFGQTRDRLATRPNIVPQRDLIEEDFNRRGAEFVPDDYCYHWIRRGVCRFAENCPFKHEFPPGWVLTNANAPVPQPENPTVSRHISPIAPIAPQPMPNRPDARPSPPNAPTFQRPCPPRFLPQGVRHGPIHDPTKLPSIPVPPGEVISKPSVQPPRPMPGQSQPPPPPPAQNRAPLQRRDNALNVDPPCSKSAHPGSTRSNGVPAAPPTLSVPAQPRSDSHPRRPQARQPATKVSGQIKPAIAPEPLVPTLRPMRPRREDLTLAILDPTRGTFGPGFMVKGVVTSNDSRAITIDHVPRSATKEMLESIVASHATVEEIRIPEPRDAEDSRPMRVQVFVASHVDAVNAVGALDGMSVLGSCVDVRLQLPPAAREQTSGGDLCFSWNLVTMRGYGGYSTEKAAKQAVKTWNGAEYRGYWVTAAVYEGLPAVSEFTVRFEGLPPDTTITHLMKTFKAQDAMLDRTPPMIPDYGVPAVEKIIRNLGKLIYLEPAPPPYQDGIVRLWCRFESPDVAGFASSLDGVQQAALKNQPLHVKRVYTLRRHIPNDICFKLQEDLDEFKTYVSRRFPQASIKVQDSQREGWSDGMMAKVIADSPHQLSKIKAELLDMLRGEVIHDGNFPLWDRWFASKHGEDWLNTVRLQHSSVVIYSDNYRSVIRVVGTLEKRRKAIDTICDMRAVLRKKSDYSVKLPSGVVGIFAYTELARSGKHGPETVWLDMTNRQLRARGDEELYEEVQRAVHRAIEKHGTGRDHAAQDKCLVCFEAPTTPVELPCGHVLCKACFIQFLEAATTSRQFPVTCFGNDGRCREPIPLIVARDTLPSTNWLALLRAAFNAHVAARPSEFRFCPTPDCPQIYRPGPRGSVYSCPSCLVRICPACHIEYHEGVACADRETEGDGAGLFAEYVREKGVKPCPKCRVPILREEGCNHVECTRCRTHICWVCMKTFKESGKVYKHMADEHGGPFAGLAAPRIV